MTTRCSPLDTIRRNSWLATALVGLLWPSAAAAQCLQFDNALGGVANSVFAVTGLRNGDVAIGGAFASARSTPANRIARWNGSAYVALGSGLDNHVRAIAELPSGDLIAAGDFANAGGAPASRIARWDGSQWSPLGSGIGSASLHGLYALAVTPNGDLYAGGYFQNAGGVPCNAIARWSNGAWSAVPGLGATVFALLALPNGELVVGGNFSTAGGQPASRIARWNGSSWSAFGSGLTGFRVDALARLPNGDLVAGGAFTAAGGVPAANIARWNGSSWSPLGSGANGDVKALVALPNGDLLAGGQFSQIGGVAAHGLARWNGSSWSAYGFGAGSQVYALGVDGADRRVAAGFFSSMGSTSSSQVVAIGSSCPAVAAVGGAGCPAGVASNVFTATTRPWLGATYRTLASDLPDPCLAAVVSGFGPANTPLASFGLPAAAGCALLVTADNVAGAVPVGGQLEQSLLLPNSAAFLGLVLHQQVLLVELDAGQVYPVRASATNRLSATVGWL